MAIAWGFLGFAMMPLLPVCLEMCAESTYPVAEETSSSVLMFAGQVFGTGLTLLLSHFLESTPSGSGSPSGITVCPTLDSAPCIMMLATALLMTGSACMYQGQMKRSVLETAMAIEHQS